VVEVPSRVDRRGAVAEPSPGLEPTYAGLVAHVSAYEELALEAAVRGGRDRVFRALLAHPLIGQHDMADRLTDRLLDANRDHLRWL
jgi:6-phospho-beta-glucosidase